MFFFIFNVIRTDQIKNRSFNLSTFRQCFVVYFKAKYVMTFSINYSKLLIFKECLQQRSCDLH